MRKLVIGISAAAVLALVAAGPALNAALEHTWTAPLASGYLTRREAEIAAAHRFDAFDLSRTGSVDAIALAGFRDHSILEAVDHDKNGFLEKPEFIRAVDRLFSEADKNKNGILDHDELNTVEGHRLLGILGLLPD